MRIADLTKRAQVLKSRKGFCPLNPAKGTGSLWTPFFFFFKNKWGSKGTCSFAGSQGAESLRGTRFRLVDNPWQKK